MQTNTQYRSISRPISKEEKEKENKNKSSPVKHYGRAVPGQVHFVDNRLCDGVTNRLYNVRHHLERTTGPGMTTHCRLTEIPYDSIEMF